MRRLARGRVLSGLGLLIALTLVFVARWLNANKMGGQGPAEPFRIAGNFYYVGATDVSAFLITGLGAGRLRVTMGVERPHVRGCRRG